MILWQSAEEGQPEILCRPPPPLPPPYFDLKHINTIQWVVGKRYQIALFTIASAMVIYVSKLPWARVWFGPVQLASCGMDRVLTPQQQCLLLVFLKLPVDQVTSTSPLLSEQCWYRPTLDTELLLKTKRPIRDLSAELASRSNVEPLDILG